MTQAYKTMGEAYREIYGEIPEGYEGNILTHLKDVGIDGRFFYGSLILRKKDVSKAKAHIKKGYDDPGTLVTKHKMPKIVAAEYDPTLDEAYKLPRQLKDPKKEVMVSKDKYGTIVIDKKDWPSYKSKGWKLAEELELELEGTMEIVANPKNVQSSLSKHKIKIMKKEKDLFLPKGYMELTISGEDKNLKAFSKDFYEEIDLDEKSKYLQYSDLLVKKGQLLAKGFIPTSLTVIKIDKEIAKELKKLGIKDGFGEELEEGRMKDLHLYIQQKKSAEWIAKKMKLDVKTVKALMSSVEYEYDPDKDSNKEKIKEAEDDESEDEKIKKAKDKADKDVQVALLKKKIADLSQKNEEVDLTEFTDAQIARLKKEYESLRGKETGINPEKFSKLRKMMRRFKKPQLLKLASADIPILTTSAKASLVINHGMKWSAIPEELVPYADELEEGTKFGSVDDKVMKRIELMIKGTREMKNSIQNMLNYLMPPEVVDMVKDKFGIKEPRGKIKIR